MHSNGDEMPEVIPVRDLKTYLEPEQVERLIDAATNLRDRLLKSRAYRFTRVSPNDPRAAAASPDWICEARYRFFQQSFHR